MKVFTCTNFRGRWPVGAAAVVVAPDQFLALTMLERELALSGLAQRIDLCDLIEVDLSTKRAIILLDGDY
jgi:hypothetical protein